MKTRITILLLAIFMSFNFSFAQQDEECMNNLSIFDSYVKSKRYDEAYGPWKIVREKCPKFNRAIYAHGEKILKHKIKNTTGAEQVAHINDLLALYDQSREHFPSKYDLGEILGDKAQLAYKYRKELGKTDEQVYNMFNDAFTKDLKNFNNPQGLYTYFSLMVDLYDAGKKTAQEMFDKYDDVMEKIDTEVKINTEKLNKLLEKEEAGTALTKKEPAYKRQYEQYLAAFDKVTSSMDQKVGGRATCEVLGPLYEKDYEEFKNDAVWLKRAVSRMYNKECTDSPLYVKLVKQYDATEPTADTKYFVATILYAQGKNKEGDQYIKESFDLEQDTFKKARLAYRIAEKYYRSGSFGQARRFYNESLKLNPSNGSPYLRIAAMYAKSANNCGEDSFSKRAVFWLAANEAEKAGRVDKRLKSAAAQTAASYRASAPSKADIFNRAKKNETIKVGCWIGRSVKVPG